MVFESNAEELLRKKDELDHSRFKALLRKRGISIEFIEPQKEVGNNGTYDDFNISVERVTSKFERITTDYEGSEWEQGKMLLQIDTINQKPISLSIREVTNNFLDEVENNQSQLICFIDAFERNTPAPLSNGTKIKFKDFPNIQFIIAKIKQRNTFGNIYRYSISRV